MPTQKTSIALEKSELAAAKKAAAAAGLSLSAFFAQLVREHVTQQARFDAMDRYLTKYAPGFELSERARLAIEAEWTAPIRPVRPPPRRKKKAA